MDSAAFSTRFFGEAATFDGANITVQVDTDLTDPESDYAGAFSARKAITFRYTQTDTVTGDSVTIAPSVDDLIDVGDDRYLFSAPLATDEFTATWYVDLQAAIATFDSTSITFDSTDYTFDEAA